jgi:amidase
MVRYCLVGFAFLALVYDGPAGAFNYVADANGTWWGIQDAAPPRVDTGSIRATQVGPGQVPVYSTSINGFAGVKVLVQTTPSPRFNGELMRGYGLTFDGVNRFATTQSIDLGGVTISRSVYINSNENWGRWLDSFTNTTKSPITIKVAFGGQSGIGSAGGNSSAIVNTSSGDAVVTAADAWVEVATPLADSMLVGGPQVTVIGTPSSAAAPFSGAMTFAGNWLFDTFNNPLSYVGHEANFQAYVNTITVQPGKTRSLLHFVVLGQMVNAASSAGVSAAVEATATGLAAAPEIGDLTLAEICSIDNFSVAALTANGFNYASCTPTHQNRMALEVMQAPVPKENKAKTNVKYDVVGKTIAQLRADLESGVTTSKEITEAYLDRIEFYDKGQFGFNSYEIVASDALEQAKAADAARKKGANDALLGIPIAVKNLFDTFDLPTTNGSMTFEGFRPARRDHRQGRARGVRDERQLLERCVGTGLERLQSLEIANRVERRVGERNRCKPRRGRYGIADRRLALRPGERREPRHATRYRRSREWHRCDAASLPH